MNRETFFARVSAQLDRAGARLARREPAPLPAAEAVGSALIARFCRELEQVGGCVHVHSSLAELELALIEFAQTSGARSLVSFGKSAFEPWRLERLWRELPITAWERGGEDCAVNFRARAADADIGLSIAELGVASSGSLLFSCAPNRPRSVTLLPRSHVAILDAASLLPDLAAALRELSRRDLPASSALFITGPSRTSDIENDLTLGVHGPAAVNVFLLDS
jgi:L-lactate dehydrogenase complex protein LldG